MVNFDSVDELVETMAGDVERTRRRSGGLRAAQAARPCSTSAVVGRELLSASPVGGPVPEEPRRFGLRTGRC